MLITTDVEMKWSNRNKTWYESKGYIWAKNGDTFIVRTQDLPNGSNIKVQYKCDSCSDVSIISFNNYTNTETDYCNTCATKIKLPDKFKLKYDFVNEEFKKRGYVLLSSTYEKCTDSTSISMSYPWRAVYNLWKSL